MTSPSDTFTAMGAVGRSGYSFTAARPLVIRKTSLLISVKANQVIWVDFAKLDNNKKTKMEVSCKCQCFCYNLNSIFYLNACFNYRYTMGHILLVPCSSLTMPQRNHLLCALMAPIYTSNFIPIATNQSTELKHTIQQYFNTYIFLWIKTIMNYNAFNFYCKMEKVGLPAFIQGYYFIIWCNFSA